MPYTNVPYEARLSDLIVGEPLTPVDVGYSRQSINVTPPAASAPVLLGTVVFRAKSADKAAPYAVVTAAGNIDVTANEYAVVFGNHFGFNASFVPNAIVANEFNSVAFVRGPITLKEYYLKQVHSGLSATNFALLKEVLAKQGVVVEVTI